MTTAVANEAAAELRKINAVPRPALAPEPATEPPAKFASICILSYERPQFLRECITSVLTTADYPFELIVHDDGSRDQVTRDLLAELTEIGVVSTLVTNPPGWNQGQGIALNRMFSIARGDPIVKMDQDMLFSQGWLRDSAEILNANWSAHYTSDSDVPRIGALGLFKYEADPVRHEEMFIRRRGGWDEVRDFVGSVMVIPRDAWSHFGPFEERSPAFAEDNTFKMAVAASEHHACALTQQDKAVNRGFGVGPSTVVVDHGKVHPIKPGPKLIGAE